MAETKQCPFCLSEIPSAAEKCRHCGEWVDGRSRPAPATPSDQSLGRFFESDDLDETLNVGIKWYVKYRIAMALVGLIVAIIFFFAFFLPQWNRVQGGFEEPGFPPGLEPQIITPGP